MRAILALALAVSTGCTSATLQSTAELRSNQEAICTATIMDHINHRPRGKVSARWASATNGRAVIEVRDGDRLHLCHIDAAGNVLGYEHPGA